MFRFSPTIKTTYNNYKAKCLQACIIRLRPLDKNYVQPQADMNIYDFDE